MPRIKKILAPTDFSDVSKLGVRYALEMARDASAEVVVYHAIEAGGEWKDNPSKVAAYHDMLEEGCGCWESLLPIISPTASISSRALRRRVRHTAQKYRREGGRRSRRHDRDVDSRSDRCQPFWAALRKRSWHVHRARS
jgi:nucleotide-binding universal stress UspA family protein